MKSAQISIPHIIAATPAKTMPVSAAMPSARQCLPTASTTGISTKSWGLNTRRPSMIPDAIGRCPSTTSPQLNSAVVNNAFWPWVIVTNTAGNASPANKVSGCGKRRHNTER